MDIIKFETLDSTNRVAMEMAKAGNVSHGTVLVADNQTAGRGQHGRTFFSPPGHGIYMSLILSPERLNLREPTDVTKLAAVYVCWAIENLTDKKPAIKPINDILLDGKKICGILTEAITYSDSNSSDWFIVGIGLNFDTPETVFPIELREIAGSLFPRGDANITRECLIQEIYKIFME